jgi:hypothetical protein
MSIASTCCVQIPRNAAGYTTRQHRVSCNLVTTLDRPLQMLKTFSLLFGVAACGFLLLITLLVSLVQRRIHWKAALPLAAGLVICGVLLADDSSKPWLDDGPFRGVPTACPSRRPDQIFQWTDRAKLDVFDRKLGDPAPTVCLRHGQVCQWCVFATAYPKTEVSRIRFHARRGRIFGDAAVTGVVTWTFGNEATTWYIDERDKLKEYWYSW